MAGVEKLFENKIKRYLQSKGIYPLGTPKEKMTVKATGYYEKRWGGGIYTKSGAPDLHIAVNGFNIDAEIKAPNGKVSDLQEFMIDQINCCNCNAMVVYPKDFEKFKKIIENCLTLKMT